MDPIFILNLQGLTGVIAVASLVLGVLSAFWPQKSIAIYIWMMARFNWIVKPVDEDKELRNTSRFGYLLMILGAVTLFSVASPLWD